MYTHELPENTMTQRERNRNLNDLPAFFHNLDVKMFFITSHALIVRKWSCVQHNKRDRIFEN